MHAGLHILPQLWTSLPVELRGLNRAQSCRSCTWRSCRKWLRS